MPTPNCTDYGSEPSMLYGYAARLVRNGLEVTLCIPSITNPIEFDINGVHTDRGSKTRLGYQLQQAREPVVIYTDVSQIPSHLREDLQSSCDLIDYDAVQFEMCVGADEIMLPDAEYDGEQIQKIDMHQNNLCSHEYGSSIDFLRSVLGYPSP